MTVCKGKLEICANSSFDKIDTYVNIDKLSIRDACKRVANDWNDEHPEATVKWESLRKSYTRYSKPSNVGTLSPVDEVKVGDNVPTIGDEEYGNVPTLLPEPYVSIELYTTVLEENDLLKNRVDELQAVLAMQSEVIDEYMLKEQIAMKETPAPQPQKNNVLLREDAFNFIMKYGSTLQKMAITNTNPDNEKMFTYFCGTRRDYIAQYPPSSLPDNIRNAESIIN